MKVGDLVVRKSYDKDITFKIIDIKDDEEGNLVYILKGISIRIIADSRVDDLEMVDNEYAGTKEKILNRLEKVGSTIYRTDNDGTIQMISDGENIEIVKIDVNFDSSQIEK